MTPSFTETRTNLSSQALPNSNVSARLTRRDGIYASLRMFNSPPARIAASSSTNAVQLLIRTHKEPLSVAVCVSNPDGSPARIQG